jgi:hypothetical protein
VHIGDLQHMPPSSDPQVQDLYALDLAGWQLHLQRRKLQRDHLTFVITQIQRVRKDPQDKSAAANEWAERQRRYVKSMEGLSAERQQLEEKAFRC